MALPAASEPSSRTPEGAPVHEADVGIIGAGVAGLFAATRLAELVPDARTVVVDKGGGVGGGGGSSPWAQGGVAVAVGADDSPEDHALDTIEAGDGHVDPAAVRVLTREGPARLRQLVELGAEFDREADGSFHLAREGGQRRARSVHRADATGAEMVRALRRSAAPVVRRLGGTALSLEVDHGGVHGVWVVDATGPALVRAGRVLLATGGCGGLFARTTNPAGATGDGVALAWRAGAVLRDLEFVQFHPTGLAGATDGTPAFLITEALRGAGATLHDADGHRFMTDVHPDAELAPRHVVTRAIVAREHVWLDATGLGEQRLREEFPTVLEGLRARGLDPVSERIEVGPVAHYQVGGVRTDLHARTSIPGLWAAGEVASTGVHGANRMAGNSLLEALVFGGRAAEDIAATAARPPDPSRPSAPALQAPPPDLQIHRLRDALRRAMWRGCGPTRAPAGLAAAADQVATVARELGAPTADPDHAELVHASTTAGLLIRAASLRRESRGGHIREDHPANDPAWQGVRLEWSSTLDRHGTPGG